MALNLSTLTNASTSATVLAEAQTTADFLDSVPILKNLARRSNKGGDAKQTTALNQPKALPVVDGKGYCYLPATTGNAPAVTFPTIGASDDFVLEMVAYVVNSDEFHLVTGANANNRFLINYSFNTHFFDGYTQIPLTQLSSGLSTLTVERSSGLLQLKQNGVVKASLSNHTRSYDFNHLSFNGQFSTGAAALNGYIQKATLSIAGTEELNIDFTATNIRHNDTKFQCATGQTVTINQAGNDPATVIKKSVLRFDGANDGLQGLFANNINSGYMFAAFSILGDGGEPFGRILSVNAAGSIDYTSGGWMFANRQASTTTIKTYVNGDATTHAALFDAANGDILYHVKVASGSQSSFVNDADPRSGSRGGTLSADTFNLGQNEDNTRGGGENAAFDLEYLAVFPVDISDGDAVRVVNYINNRNNVFDLKDSLGYYFFDPQALTDHELTGTLLSGTWDGRIVGSDLGDNTLEISQTTGASQPVADKYKVTFADNNDHLLFDSAYTPTFPAGQDKAWQVVGTSLGTFAYRVNANAVTELNLLGNLGSATYRQAGDLYGVILLPESATGADIEAARKLLIDRGASDGVTGSSLATYWLSRGDIVEFKGLNTSGVNSFYYTWHSCSSLTSFPFIDTSSGATFQNAWYGCSSMSNFGPTEMSNGTNFTNAWNGCTALTSFPAGAKLGTEAASVNFSNAWMNSGLTSFPPLDLSNANNFSNAFRGTAITQFPSDALLGTDKTNVNFNSAFRSSDIISFSTPLPTGNTFADSFKYCGDLTDVSVDVFTNWNPSTIANACFNDAWTNCTSLTAQSVENILTSISASGKHATSTGASGGSALGDAGIDIDYNTVGGTSPLSAATNTAIDSLSGKGWEVFINGVLVIPNILDLAPAAAYSLRSFDSAADPDVVNVRRSSDNAPSDFKASEVSDGTLTTWVNTDVDLVTPTLNNGGFEGGLTGWGVSSASADTNEFYAGTQSAKITVIGGGGAYIYKTNFSLQAGASYRVGFWAKISDASKQARVEFGNSANKEDISFTSTDWEYKEVTKTATAVTLAFNRQTGSGDYTVNFDNITVTQLTADGHVTTWYDQSSNGRNGSQFFASEQPKIVDGGALVTEGGLAAVNFHTETSYLFINHTNLYGQATLDSYYVTNATGDAYIYPTLVTNGASYGMTATAASPDGISINYGSPSYYANGTQITGGTRGDIYTATSGGQKLVAHIGADTTDSIWGTATMNFGNYYNSTIYGFTGKLQEMIFFNTDQSANRTGIEKNINDTYTIY
jgi:hypothetical protein